MCVLYFLFTTKDTDKYDISQLILVLFLKGKGYTFRKHYRYSGVRFSIRCMINSNFRHFLNCHLT